MKKIKVIELFAGIAVQREALQRAGIEHEVVAISGAVIGAVTEGIKIGSWEGAVSGAVNGAADGALNPKLCFVAGTLVMTKQGLKAIEEI